MMRNGKKKNEIKMKGILKVMYFSISAFFLTLSNAIVAFAVADTNYGKNAASVITDNLFWIAIVVVLIAVVGCAAKKNWIAALTTFIGGSVVCFFVKNPEQIANIGEAIGNAIFK